MGKITKFQKKCLVCDDLFFTTPSRIKSNKGKYCSKRCHAIDKKNNWGKEKSPNWVERKKYSCLICNKEFKRLESAIKNNNAFCSRPCYWKWLSENVTPPSQKGKKPWNYKGITPKNKLERARFKREILKKVFERDDYTCQICGQRGGNLQVDHIQSWVDYVELRFNINNCRTLCMACHYKITFGKPMPPTVRAWGKGNHKGGQHLFLVN